MQISSRSRRRTTDVPIAFYPNDETIRYRRMDARTWQVMICLPIPGNAGMVLVTLRHLAHREWHCCMSDPDQDLTITLASDTACQSFVIEECRDRLGLSPLPEPQSVALTTIS